MLRLRPQHAAAATPGRRALAPPPARAQRRPSAPALLCARVCPAAAALAPANPRPRHPRLRKPLPSPPNSTPSTTTESVCYTGTVTWDNDASEDCTVLAIDATDYDGLLRVIAWVLYGLQLRIRAAVLRSTTAEEEAEGLANAAMAGEASGSNNNRAESALGRALAGGAGAGLGGLGGSVTDVFWVTDRRGRKLSDKSADGVAERLQEFISTCAPDEDAGARFEQGLQGWECAGGGIHATNGAHPKYTQLTVTADDYSPGLVLEVTSVIAGMGVAVREAVVRSGGLKATLGGANGGGNGSGGNGGGGTGQGSRPAPAPSPPLGMEPSVAAEISRALETMPEPPPGKRVLRFWLYDRSSSGVGGGKLSFAQVQALLYCIGLATGTGNLSTTPPNKTITGCACSPQPPVHEFTAAASGGGRGRGGGGGGIDGGATTTAGWTTAGEESS